MYKTFSIFPDNSLVHAYSTRKGGVSPAPFDSLNLGKNTKDDPLNVDRNRGIFFDALNIDKQRCVFPSQVHSANIEIVDKPGIVSNCDALITREKNLYLTIQTADCFPVFIYDPVNETAALAHSGWRGTAQNIAGKTIMKMNGNPADMLAAIAPGIRQSCYQVDDKTAAYFDQKYLQPDGDGHFKLDVLSAIRDQLIEAGLAPQNIETDIDCTHCRSDLYYSYRRDGDNSGRMMSVIGMK